MGESRPSEEAIALFTNVFGYAPDPEALHAGECWQAERIDAALRRAKAEGRIKSMWEAVHIANTYNCDHNHGKKATEAVDNVLLKLYDRIAELEADARAAQIEEGE